MSNKVYMEQVDYNGTFEQLGNNFIQVGKDFIDLYKRNLGILDFSSMSVDETPSCGTVACHGGWGLVLYTDEGTDYDTFSNGYTSHFIKGAQLIEQRLGFEPDEGKNLENFAFNNPVIWGNEFGKGMFSSYGYLSFGNGDMDITIEDIGKHYIEVGKRILERKDWTIG